MKQVKFTNRHINLNPRGYSYLHIPKPVAEALESRWVDLVLTDSGLLVIPKDEPSRKRWKLRKF